MPAGAGPFLSSFADGSTADHYGRVQYSAVCSWRDGLTHQVYCNQYPSLPIPHKGLRIIPATASGNLEGALEEAHRYRAFVQAAQPQADLTAAVLECGAVESPTEGTTPLLQSGQVARLLDVMIDILRNWIAAA